jgi:L-lactate dehydrogenase complex protein LldG
MSNARDTILGKLRATLARPDLRFPPKAPPPLTTATRMTVTQAEGEYEELAERFGTELSALHGTYEVAETATEARLALINRLMQWMEQEQRERKGAVIITGQEHSVLAWDAAKLPVPGLDAAMDDLGLKLVAPADLRTAEQREAVRHIRYGVTGVEAAFASTGSMLMLTGAGAARAASLLPFRHIALIPYSRLYRTLEEWLSAQRTVDKLDDILRSRANLTLITGPSKSADIEMNLTLGVHGPKFVHAILFDDMPADFDSEVFPTDDPDAGFEEEDDASADGGFDAEDGF